MGMTVHLVGVRAEILEALRRHPSVLDLVYTCRGQVATLRERAAQAQSGLIDHLVLAGAKLDDLVRFAAEPALEDVDRCTHGEVDLEKTWAGIHFLLTGEPEPGRQPATAPLAWALGGSEAALEGTPHQVAPRVVGEQAVAEVAGALKSITADQLRTRFDPAVLVAAGVYPERMWKRADALDDLLARFADLVWFYKRAAALGWSVLVCTTL